MVQYKCDNCNKIFKQKSHYECHMNRKFPCKSNKVNISKQQQFATKIQQTSENEQQIAANNIKNMINKKQCIYCDKVFTRLYTLNVHMKGRCKIKKEMDQEKEDLMTKLIKEREEQKKIIENQNRQIEKQNNRIEEIMKEVKKLKDEKTKALKYKNQTIETIQNAENIQNNTNCNNKINNIHNEIKIIAYGKEDLSHILENDYKMILNKGLKSVPALVEYIHFNKSKPENHNIYISNMRNNYVLVYDGNEWQLKEREDVLQDMVYIKTDILSDKFDELLESLSEPIKRKFNRFLENKDEDAVINSIKKDIKLLMYNKRKLIENTRNEIAKNDNQKTLT